MSYCPRNSIAPSVDFLASRPIKRAQAEPVIRSKPNRSYSDHTRYNPSAGHSWLQLRQIVNRGDAEWVGELPNWIL